METTSDHSLTLGGHPVNGAHDGSPLIRRRGVTINKISARNINGTELLHSGSQFIEVILDTPGSKEIKRCCHFGDDDSLEKILSTVTDVNGVDLSLCQVVLLSQPDILPNLSRQAAEFANQSILILSPTRHNTSTETDGTTQPSTVDQCIAYFSCYGLKPFDGTTCMSPKLHTSLIKGLKNWEDLLDQETIEDFTEEEEYQQQAIWELLYTEYTYLTQLAIVINTFMKCLEYMQSINLLNEVNYHSIFGQMRDLYKAHSKFWNTTLLPCLQKAANDCKPLDVDDLITDFPQFSQLFEVYEHHCIFGLHSMQALDEAMSSTEFNAYIKWCETKPECKRLRLKDFLAKPMQRLTKYPLLLKAILGKTSAQESRTRLQKIVSMVDEFVSKVNAAVRHQEEVEKVKSVIQRLATMCVVHDIPSGWEKCLQAFSQLDLLAPMPGVSAQKQLRTLIMEGALRYKEDTTKIDAHVFLFTDMLLITRASKKSPNQLVITKAPFKIDTLIAKPSKDPAVVDLVCLNELKLISTVFSLKAATPQLAATWIENIKQTQQLYYQLRCNYESQMKQQPNVIVWSDTNQRNGIRHSASYGSNLSQPVSSFLSAESTTRGYDATSNNEISTSTWLSPPIFYVVTQDTSTQTDDTDAPLSQQDNDKKNNKQSFLKMITVKRSASFGDQRKERTPKNDEKSLSHSSSSLKREEMMNNHSPAQKPKRTKSLKLTV